MAQAQSYALHSPPGSGTDLTLGRCRRGKLAVFALVLRSATQVVPPASTQRRLAPVREKVEETASKLTRGSLVCYNSKKVGSCVIFNQFAFLHKLGDVCSSGDDEIPASDGDSIKGD